MIEIPLGRIIFALLTISVRISGLMLFAPFFGSVAIPPRVKAALVVGLSVLLYPEMSSSVVMPASSHWPTIVIRELLIGAAIGIASNLVFDAVQMAGQVLSAQMGFSLASLIDPQTQADSTVVAMFHQTIAMLIFLRLDVHLWLLHTLGRSFQLLPPASMNLSGDFAIATVRAAGAVFALGLQMAAPVFSATLLTDIVLGVIGQGFPKHATHVAGPTDQNNARIGRAVCCVEVLACNA